MPKKPCKRCLTHLRYTNNRQCVHCATQYQAKRRRERAIAVPEEVLLISAKHRARRLGLPFDLSPDDIQIPDTCPVLGIPLKMAREGRADVDYSPSLDRLIPERGYIAGNILVVSWRANRIRNDHAPDDLIRVGNFYKSLLNS